MVDRRTRTRAALALQRAHRDRFPLIDLHQAQRVLFTSRTGGSSIRRGRGGHWYLQARDYVISWEPLRGGGSRPSETLVSSDRSWALRVSRCLFSINIFIKNEHLDLSVSKNQTTNTRSWAALLGLSKAQEHASSPAHVRTMAQP